MFEFTGLSDMKGWMTRSEAKSALGGAESTSGGAGGAAAEYPEPSGSVVISSRVRLARNLSAFPYPGRCPADQETECRDRILEAFRHLPNAQEFAILDLDELSSLERRILFERNLVSQGYSMEKHKALALSNDEAGGRADRRRGPPPPGRDERGRVPGAPSWHGWTRWTSSSKGRCSTRCRASGAT